MNQGMVGEGMIPRVLLCIRPNGVGVGMNLVVVWESRVGGGMKSHKWW